MANDLNSLRQLVTEAKTKWLADVTKGAEYYPVILELCLAVNSMASTRPELYDAMRDLAVSVIDSPNKKSPELTGKLLLLLQGDPEYSRGQLRGERWVEERHTRTKRWLNVWKTIREQFAALPEPSGPFYMNVTPPAETRLPNGVAPSAIKDPVLRKRYEDAIEKNTRNINAYQKKRDFADFEKRFASNATRYVINAYSKPPFQTEELEKTLEGSALDANVRAEIVAETKKRIAARMEREAKQPPPPTMKITEPELPPDAPTHHADPRLRVKVSFDLASPRVDDVLHELRAATKVDLSRADDIQNRYPSHGSLSFRKVPAWQVMDMLAKSKWVEGRWEKEGTGYRLVPNGNPVNVPGAMIDRPGKTFFYRRMKLYLSFGSLVVLVLVFTIYWLLRLKKQHPTA
ncbi:MAG TPA: hypothetical protein VH575_10320 [Gemmataceae bacterium]|jgi:hypothetical protein